MSKITKLMNVMKTMRDSNVKEGDIKLEILKGDAQIIAFEKHIPYKHHNHDGHRFHGHGRMRGHASHMPINKWDRMMFGLKMLDKLEIETDEATEVLSIDMTYAEMPDHLKEVFAKKSEHMDEIKAHIEANDEEHAVMIKEIFKALEDKGIDIKDLTPSLMNVQAVTDKGSHIQSVITQVTLADATGEQVTFIMKHQPTVAA